jgi:branched-chain amino acid transport system substrate-binding protein
MLGSMAGRRLARSVTRRCSYTALVKSVKKQLSVLYLASAVLICGPALSEQGESSHQHEKLRIGVIQSLSGIAAEDGKTVVQALQLAADKINQTNAIKVELLTEDDGSDSKQAVTAFKKLQGQGVDAFVGPTWSFTFNSIVPMAARDGLIAVNTSTLPECLDLKKSQGFAFSTATSVNEHARVFRDYLEQKPAKSALIFYTSNSWGEAQRVAYARVLQDKGVKILREIPSVDFDVNDWRALLPREKMEGADLWILLLNKSDLDIVIRRAREISVGAALYASYHFGDTWRLAGGRKLFDEVCFSYPDEQISSEKEFLDSYVIRYGIPPRVFADSTYDALFLLHSAFKESLAKKVPLKVALTESHFTGVAGHYRFDEKTSFSTGRASLMCVKDGIASQLN